jgi:hypothetical protein
MTKSRPIRFDPKLNKRERSEDAWYSYYAGYSADFVNEVLRGVPLSARVFDPWNGAGTTTTVAWTRGLTAIGLDLNPVMVLVAKSRLLDASVGESIESLSDEIVRNALRSRHEERIEPLHAYFTPHAARNVRRLEVSMRKILIGDKAERLTGATSLNHVSSLAAYYYTALFKVVRSLCRHLRTSNPTWLIAPSDEHKINISANDLAELYRDAVRNMRVLIESNEIRTRHEVNLDIGDSRSPNIEDDSVDCVISSPPYCTRIDYVIKTRPELAVLGADAAFVRHLRDGMLGTPTIADRHTTADEAWGLTCTRFLGAVRRHASVASSRYYSRNLTQYFRSLYMSCEALRRVMRRRSTAVLVVQDSYYKDLHNDLPRILTEMMGNLAFRLSDRHDVPVKRTFGAINPRTRKYRESASATEAVLFFEKEDI